MATHEYWRLNISAVDGSTLIQIGEMEYHDSIGGANKSTNALGTATAHQESTAATNAFDEDNGTGWLSNVIPGWLRFQFDTPIDVVEYSIQLLTAGFLDRIPKDWTLGYSDDGSSWTVVDTVTGETGWSSGEIRTFAVPEPPPTQGVITITGNTPVPEPTYAPKKTINGYRFICTITGAADGLDDVIIPISSISGTLNSSGLSSLLIICPNGLLYGSDISDRANGDFIITTTELYTDGTNESTDSANFHIGSIASDRGANSWSISIRGSYTDSAQANLRYDAEGVNSISVNDEGQKRVRLAYNSDIRPGDTLSSDLFSDLIVDRITYTISSINKYMTITEGV